MGVAGPIGNTMTTQSGPVGEYERRLAARRARVTACERQTRVLSDLRLLLFAAAVIVAVAAWRYGDSRGYFVCTLPALAFFVAAFRHERVERDRLLAARAASFYEDGLRRMRGEWRGHGIAGDAYAASSHLFARDLDLFGVGSLFELLCIARTRSGEETLAKWLSAAAEPQEVRRRQAAIEELRNGLDLREEVAVLGHDVRAAVPPTALSEWAEGPGAFRSRAPLWLARGLAVTAVISATAWATTPFPAFPFFLVILAEILAARVLRDSVEGATRAIEGHLNHLRLIASVLERIEERAVTAPLLGDLRHAIRAEGVSAPEAVRSLQKAIEWMDAANNQLFALIAFALQWKIQWAYVLDGWRERHGHRVAGWLDALGTWEALSSLAGYAYERPDDPFPDIIDGGAVYEAKDLGHPLIPEQSCVRNSVMLGAATRCLIVSGSNMSGKSTLLRAVGLNAVLANAGAPVRATALRVSPLSIGATIRIEDDVHEGASRFYAEITRLREITKLLDSARPLLFLLDEIFAGTNSHDRGIGAAAVVRGLVEAGAIGLVTTHDLALTSIAQDSRGRIENVHFEDHLENGKLSFDYQMRPGIVKKSNALELMRSIGLRV